MDDAFCGGGDANNGLTSTAIPIQASAVNMIKAAIFMGNPRYIYGLSYEVGTCRAQGVSPLIHTFHVAYVTTLICLSISNNVLTIILVRTSSLWIFLSLWFKDQVLLRCR